MIYFYTMTYLRSCAEQVIEQLSIDDVPLRDRLVDAYFDGSEDDLKDACKDIVIWYAHRCQQPDDIMELLINATVKAR